MKFQMLYSRRKWVKDRAEKEAAGESFWTTDISRPVRVRLGRIVDVIATRVDSPGRYQSFTRKDIFDVAQQILIHDMGVENLVGLTGADDFEHYLNEADSNEMPDVFEALAQAISLIQDQEFYKKKEEQTLLDDFSKRLNKILENERVKYSLEGTEVVDFDSKEIHAEVVAPTLRLLSGREWEEVEESYRKALKDLSRNAYDDAIKSAATALQDALRKLGCKGDNFTSLTGSARATLLKKYDGKYIEGIVKMIEWVSASRGQKGAVHKYAKPEKEDAWFVIHTVGILILHLSGKRQSVITKEK